MMDRHEDEVSFIFGSISLFSVPLVTLGAIPRVGEEVTVQGERRRDAVYNVERVIYVFHDDGEDSARLRRIRVCLSRDRSPMDTE